MTHPEGEVGGANDTVVAAEPTIDDRFAAAYDNQDDPEKKPDEDEGAPPTATPQGDGDEEQPELSAEDVDDDAEEAGEEGRPIKPPVSFTAEEKEAFKSWPRDAQEAVTRRVGEMEKGLHAKAQEAKQVRAQTEQEALATIRQMQDNYAAQLQVLMPRIPEKPSRQLQADDPWTYASQMEAYEGAVAQASFIQQQLQTVQAARTANQQAARNQALLLERDALQEALPEWFDASEGPKLHAAVKSIALDLGFSDEQLNDATANEILALRKVSDFKAKAEKYDALMVKKMEQVRAAKGLPKVSRPGSPQGKGALANQRYTADRQAMQKGDKDAEARVFSRFL
jgi:hypothetical protein